MNPHRVGFLATGSELINGDVLNTNTPQMAKRLQSTGADLGEHIMCDDQPLHMEQALQFLMQHHRGILITGGLGPTSDDCTREVIAHLTQHPLYFSEEAWQAIVTRLRPRYSEIPETNRRQAYFPEGAQLLKNPNGTAWGFHLKTSTHDFIALPGPPLEALPLFETQVLPILESSGYFSDFQLLTWRVTGISEALIAERIDAIGSAYGLAFEYRAHSPFIDIKLWISQTHPDWDAVQTAVQAIIQSHEVPD